MARKPTYSELENRVRELEQSAAEYRHILPALRKSDREKDSLLNSMTELVAYYKNKDLRVEWANRATAEAIGKPREQLLGEHCYNLWHGSHKPCEGCPVLKSFDTGEPEQKIEPHASRGNIWKLRSYPVKDEQGNILGVMGFTENITREEHMEEERKRLLEVIETAREAVVITSAESTMLYTNQAMDELFGYDRGELIGKHSSVLNAASDPDAQVHLINETVEKNGFWEGKIRNRKKDGTEFISYARISAHLDKDGRIRNYLSTQHDITEETFTQEELRRHDAILGAVSFAAESFLTSSSWEDRIPEILERLGKAAEVSSVYIFENHTSDDEKLKASQRYSWLAPDTEPQASDQALQGVSLEESGFGNWVDTLSRGEIVCGNVQDFPDAKHELLLQRNIKSFVTVPLFVYGKWWGVIGFDDRMRKRDWSTIEIDALRMSANMIGSAIQRYELIESLMESEVRYRSLIENLPIGLYRNTPGPQGRFIMANPAVAHMHGCDSVEEFLEIPVADWYVDAEERRIFSEKLLAEGNAVAHELQLKRRDGDLIWGAVTARVVRNEQGHIESWIMREEC